MKKEKFLRRLLFVIITIFGMGSFVSCTDDYSDSLAELRATLMNDTTNLRAYVDAQVRLLQSNIDALRIAQSDCQDKCKEAQRKLQEQITLLGEEQTKLENLQKECKQNCETKFGELNDKITTMKTELVNSINSLSSSITNHETAISNLKNEIVALKTADTQLGNSIRAAEIEIGSVKTRLDAAEGLIRTNQTAIGENTQNIATNAANIITLNTTLTNAVNTLNNAITNTATIANAASTLASEAKAAAEQADANATAAKADAASAVVNANSALAKANEVSGKVEEAKNIANTAKDIADAAKTVANNAKTTAEAAKSAAENAQETANAAKTLAETNAGVITTLQTDVSNVNTKAENAMTKATEAFDKAQSTYQLYEAVKAIADKNGTDITKIFGNIEDLNDSIDKLKLNIIEAEGLITEAKTIATQAQTTANTALAATVTNAANISQNAQEIGVLQTWSQSVDETIIDVYDKLSNVYTKSEVYTKEEVKDSLKKIRTDFAQDINNLQTTLEGKIVSTQSLLEGKIGDLQTTLEGKISDLQADLEDEIDAVEAKFDDYYTKSEIDTKLDDYYTKSEIDAKVDDITDRLDGIDTEITEIKAEFDNYYKKTELYTQSEIDSKLDDIDTKIANLESAYKAADQELQSAIDNLDSKLDTFIDEVSNKFNAVNDRLNKLITGIIIQGVTNPVYGSISFPAGINTQMLMAFYGSYMGEDTNWPEDEFTVAENSMLGSYETDYIENGEKLVSDRANGKAYIGKVYTTINPNTVNFSGCTLDIVNSQDEQCYVNLEPLKPSNKVLKYGFMKAVNNGFYEADAYIDAANISKVKVTKNMDVAALKQVAKDVLKTIKESAKTKSIKNHINVTTAYSAFVKSFSDFLDAEGLKATWKDSAGTHSIYSPYSMAVTSIKPLSYDFLKGYETPQIPTIPSVEYEIEMTLNRPDYHDVQHISDISVTIEIEGETYTAPVTGINKFIDSLNVAMKANINENINELIDQIQEQVEYNVDNVLNIINSNLVDRVNSVIGKVNSKLKDLNHYLQPTIVFKTNGNSGGVLSNTYALPTKVKMGSATKGGIVFYPTSFTADLFAPSYLKFVAVTNVLKFDTESDIIRSAQKGDATCKAALDYANNYSKSNMKKILKGKVNSVGLFTKSEYKDCVYEITYVAMDYSGKTVKTQYYIKVE